MTNKIILTCDDLSWRYLIKSIDTLLFFPNFNGSKKLLLAVPILRYFKYYSY